MLTLTYLERVPTLFVLVRVSENGVVRGENTKINAFLLEQYYFSVFELVRANSELAHIPPLCLQNSESLILQYYTNVLWEKDGRPIRTSSNDGKYRVLTKRN